MDYSYSKKKRTFENSCKVIFLNDEYYGFTGREKYAIVTRLRARQLFGMFQEEFKVLRPFVIISPEVGEVIRDYKREDECYRKRYSRGNEFLVTCLDSEDTVFESLRVEDEQTKKEQAAYELERKNAIKQGIHSGLNTLTELQRKYLIEHHLMEKPIKQIAEEEGKSSASISVSIKNAKKKIKNAFQELEVV